MVSSSGTRARRAARVAALVRACHPEPTVAVTAAIAALAAVAGRSPAGVALVAAAVLAGQLAIGWSNDALDAERDRRSRRTDKPVAAGVLSPRAVGIAAIVAAVVSVPLGLASGTVPGILHAVAVAGGLAYNLGLKSTVFSVVPYAVTFGVLPAYAVLPALSGPPPPWLVAAGSLLGAGAHFANVLPDLADDAATGVRGLPHRLGAAASRGAAAALLLAASAVLALGPPGPPTVVGLAALGVAVVAVAAGLVLGRRPGSRAPFRAVLVVAVVDVALLLVSGSAL